VARELQGRRSAEGELGGGSPPAGRSQDVAPGRRGAPGAGDTGDSGMGLVEDGVVRVGALFFGGWLQYNSKMRRRHGGAEVLRSGKEMGSEMRAAAGEEGGAPMWCCHQ
jgi:hypothetical protein